MGFLRQCDSVASGLRREAGCTRTLAGGTVCLWEACEHGCLAMLGMWALLFSTGRVGSAEREPLVASGCSPVVTALVVSRQIIGSQDGRITVGKVDLQPWKEFGLICKGDHAEVRPISCVAAGKAWVMLKDLHPVKGCPVVSRQWGLTCLSSAGICPAGGLLPHTGLW